MISFLSKIGSLIVEAKKVVPFFLPIVKAYTPDSVDRKIDIAMDSVDQFAAAVVDVEAISKALGTPLTGQQKFLAVQPRIAQIVYRGSVIAAVGGPSKIKNKALYDKAVAGYAQATVDLLNSLNEDAVQ